MIRRALPLLATFGLAACGGIQIKPDPVLPKALVQMLPAEVGLIVADDMRNFKHSETRWGSEWNIDLGGGHSHLVRDTFKAAFREVREFPDLEAARKASGLEALFEPRIEQYSFATARETGGRYYAVTVRYRINMYTPGAELADTFTLTGYGNSLAKGMSTGKPLEVATVAAMRDAAAKFLVQFPGLPAGKRLAGGEAIVVETKEAVAAADAAAIDAVPIEESETILAAVSATPASPAPPLPAPAPAPNP